MTTKIKYLLLIPLFTFSIQSRAQYNFLADESDSSFLQAFKKGQIEGHFRLFSMMTLNAETLTDYYAVAFGGRLKYQTRSYKGFQLGIGGYFTWNLSSSDLVEPDSITKMPNRYEVGLFDQTDPAKKKGLQGLEHLFVRYNFKNSSISIGKQVINTPFMNEQDGRMHSNAQQGLWIVIKEIDKTKIEFGWINHVSPRGTLKWYKGAGSIGVYPTGLSIDGRKSDYSTSLSSKGIAIGGITYTLNKQIKIQAWDHWTDNIFNTIQARFDGEFTIAKGRKIIAAGQYVHQHAIHFGGNPDPSKTYFDPTQKVNIYSGRAGLQTKKSELRFNYTHITDRGRFLFPREWGREPLFTFLSRERNEGLGNVNAYSVNFMRHFSHQKLNFEIGAGYYDLPDVKNARLNKYGLPSYCQFNADLKYSFTGFLNGLTTELLYLYKQTKGNIYEDLRYAINKTDMQQVNIIVNYHF